VVIHVDLLLAMHAMPVSAVGSLVAMLFVFCRMQGYDSVQKDRAVAKHSK